MKYRVKGRGWNELKGGKRGKENEEMGGDDVRGEGAENLSRKNLDFSLINLSVP